MSRETLHVIAQQYNIPSFFFRTYRKYIAYRILAGAGLLIAAAFVSLYAADIQNGLPS